MRKILIVMMLLLFLPLFVKAKEDVYIKSVTKEEISGDVVEKSEPSFNGLELNFDLKFSTIDSYIKYKVILQNDSDEAYKLSDSGSKDGEYFSYIYEFEDNNSVIKAGESKILMVSIKLNKKVPRAQFVNSIYNEETRFDINLSNDVKNPNTKIGISIVVISIFVLAIISFVLLTKKKNALYLLALLFVIPIVVHAIKNVNITINTKIEIDRSCSYKLVTKYGSFSKTEDIKEVCVDLDDEYEYKYRTYNLLIGPGNTDVFNSKDKALVSIHSFPDNDWYYRVYKDETKKDLLMEVTNKDIYKYDYSIGTNTHYQSYYSEEFDKSEGYYVEKSEGVDGSVLAVDSELKFKTDVGPWFDYKADVTKVNNLKESLRDLDANCNVTLQPNQFLVNYDFKSFTNCHIYEEGKENVCEGNIYYAKINVCAINSR